MTDDEIVSALQHRLEGIEAHVKDPPARPLRSVVPVAPVRPRRRGKPLPGLLVVAVVAIALVAIGPMLDPGGSLTPGGTATTTSLATGRASVAPDLVIDGVAVRCDRVESTICRDVAARGIGQFGRGGPGDRILVRDRAGCPPVRSYVDPAACWEVEAPRGEVAACIVIARRLDGVYAQVAGDSVSGQAVVPGSVTPGCPPVPALVALDPLEAPEELPGPCLEHAVTIDRYMLPLEDRARVADAVVIGTISEVGSTRWSSADGRAPAGDGDGIWAITMIRITVDQVIAGRAPSTVAGWMSGGTIGCHTFSVDGVTRPMVGAREVFFLGEPGQVAGVDGVVGVFERAALVDGTVVLQVEGAMPLETFLERAGGS